MPNARTAPCYRYDGKPCANWPKLCDGCQGERWSERATTPPGEAVMDITLTLYRSYDDDDPRVMSWHNLTWEDYQRDVLPITEDAYYPVQECKITTHRI